MKKTCSDHDCSRRSIERRTLLKGTAAGTLLLALPVACQSTVSPPTGPVPAGNVSAILVGTLNDVPGEALILGRDTDGLYAMSAACTHAGCMVSIRAASEDLYCPCHGSVFDADGAVTHGPASAPLPHFLVDLAADGSITVHGEQSVAADARTKVS